MSTLINEESKRLIDEIIQIRDQYQAEVGKGLHRAWPKSIRERVMALDSMDMNRKADDQVLYFDLKEKRGIQLLTTTRKGMHKTPSRRKMIRELKNKKFRKIYRQRSTTVEPMQGLMADIFDLDKC